MCVCWLVLVCCLKVELGDIYEQINRSVAKNNAKRVQDNVTEKTWTSLRQEMQDRRKMGWQRVDWRLSKPVGKIELLQGRVMQADDEVFFAQLTCR